MVGSHPTVEDGIVDRQVCFATSATESCGTTIDIKVSRFSISKLIKKHYILI